MQHTPRRFPKTRQSTTGVFSVALVVLSLLAAEPVQAGTQPQSQPLQAATTTVLSGVSDTSCLLGERPMIYDRSALPGSDGLPAPCQDYIIVLKSSVGAPGILAKEHAATLGARVKTIYRSALKGYAATVPASSLAALRADPRVALVERDHKVTTFEQETPTGIKRAFADDNPEIGIDGRDEKRVDADIAILDTGIDYDNPDLNLVGRTDCTVGGGPFATKPVGCLDDAGTDDAGHGTHVAGTAAALDNGKGVVGVAPGARLWSVRVLSGGSGTTSQVIAGVDWVTNHSDQIEVANLSLGCQCEQDALAIAITNSVAQGVTYVVSAGNSSTDAQTFTPANHPDVVTVSALADFDGMPGGKASSTCIPDEDDTLANYSNFGEVVDVAAPGTCILSTWNTGGLNTISGTSMAAPHISGAAALLASRSKPVDKAGVDAIKDEIVDAGNFNWRDVRPICGRFGCSGEAPPDAVHEPLLDVSDSAIFSPVTKTGPFNALPKARYSVSCDGSATCSFDGRSSYDPDGHITTYTWDFGDRSASAVGQSATHTFKRSGTYAVTLRISDQEGATGRHVEYVIVTNGKGNRAADIEPSRPRCSERDPVDNKCESWIGIYDNPNGYHPFGAGDDDAQAGAVSPTGDQVYATGRSWDNTTQSYDWATAGYDAKTGERVWVSRYNGPGDIDDDPIGIIVSPDGKRVYVTGVADTCYTCQGDDFARQRLDIATVAYNAHTGRRLWVASFGSPYYSDFGAEFPSREPLALSTDGRLLYVAGLKCDDENSFEEFPPCHWVTMAYAASTGRNVWTQRNTTGVYGTDIGVSGDGRQIFVTGTIRDPGTGSQDFGTVAYAARTGAQLWDASYDGGQDDSGASVEASPDASSVYVVGNACTFSGSFAGFDDYCDRVLLSYDAANGSQQWISVTPGSADDWKESAEVDMSPDGDRLYVTESSPDNGYTNALVVAYGTASGERDQGWQIRPGTRGGFTATTVSADGSLVYTSGQYLNGQGGGDVATGAYTSGTAQQIWAARYNSNRDGTNPDAVADIIAGPDGSVYAITTFSTRRDDLDHAVNRTAYGVLAYGLVRRHR